MPGKRFSADKIILTAHWGTVLGDSSTRQIRTLDSDGRWHKGRSRSSGLTAGAGMSRLGSEAFSAKLASHWRKGT